MKIYEEKSLADFSFWSGAVETAKMLTRRDFKVIEEVLEQEEEYWSDTEINDLFWFCEEMIAEWLGYDSWEELEKDRTTKREG